MRWGFEHGEGAAIHMYGRYARLTVKPSDATRQRLLDLADWVDATWDDHELPIGIGVENFPTASIFGHRESVDITVSIGLRLNSVHQDEGLTKIAGMVDAHRKRVAAVPASFWAEAAERLGSPLGTVAKPTSIIDEDNPLRDKDELLLVHASDGIGCRYAVGVKSRTSPDAVKVPRSIKGMRNARERGVLGYHLWVETTTQLSIRDSHRKKMAEAVRQYDPEHIAFCWLESVAH